MLQRSLYPSGKLVRFLVKKAEADLFAADREFIRRVGQLTGSVGLDAELRAYTADPENRRFLRRGLKMRVSGKKVSRLLRDVMRDGDANG